MSERELPNRYLVEITEWTNGLHVGLSPASAPADARFQGGLLYAFGFEIEGTVVAPETMRGERVQAWTLPLDPQLDLTGADRVGWLYQQADRPEGDRLSATLHLPP